MSSSHGFEDAHGLLIPEWALSPPPESRPMAIDLFAGAGGFSCGIHQAGFHVVGALEFDYDAATTYMVNLANPGVQIHFDTPEREAGFAKKVAKAMGVKIDADGYVVGAVHGTPPQEAPFRNRTREKKQPPKSKVKKAERPIVTPFVAGSGWISHYNCSREECGGSHDGIGYDGEYSEYLAQTNARPEHPYGCEHFWIADAKNVSGRDMLDALGLEQGDVDLVVGGPPCQGFSIAGRRNVVDPRNSLVFEFARLVLEIQPKAMVMENVPGIMSMTTPEGLPVVDALCKVLSDGGFGSYEALRKSILTTSGSGAALRDSRTGRSRSRKAKPPELDPEPQPEQERLAV